MITLKLNDAETQFLSESACRSFLRLMFEFSDYEIEQIFSSETLNGLWVNIEYIHGERYAHSKTYEVSLISA